MEPLKQSIHIRWAHNCLEKDGENIAFSHPPGDYSELNRYIERIDNIMQAYCPDGVYYNSLEYEQNSKFDYLYLKHLQKGSTLYSTDISKKFWKNATEHQKVLIPFARKMILELEKTYYAHPLLFDGQVSFTSLIAKDGVGQMPSAFFIPHGQFPKSIHSFETVLAKMRLFLPEGHINIVHHKNISQNTFAFEINIQKSQDSTQAKIVHYKSSFNSQNMDEQNSLADIIDQFLSLSLNVVDEKIQQLELYQKAQQKIDFYHHLDNTINQNDSSNSLSESRNLKI